MATRKVRRTRRRRRRGGRATLTRKAPPRKSVKIVRYYMNGCGACKMSEKAWNDFCNNLSDGVEHQAIESEHIPESARIKAFPTYVVFENGRETKRQPGAIMDSAKITQLLPD